MSRKGEGGRRRAEGGKERDRSLSSQRLSSYPIKTAGSKSHSAKDSVSPPSAFRLPPSAFRLSFDELGHRVHDYRHLIERWRAVARAVGWRLRPFAKAGKYPCYYLQTPGAETCSDGTIYISAGIHGDEPAGPEALLHWAERRLPALARNAAAPPLLLFPCLNPWGLVNNLRSDADGNDLNRIFDRDDVAPIGEWKKIIAGRRFALALALHEDYDARGFYVYEVCPRPARSRGKTLLTAAAGLLPADTRARIDRRPFKNGLKLICDRAARRAPMHPETLYLYRHHTDHTFTVETPSEFSLARRVETLIRLIEECVRLAEEKA